MKLDELFAWISMIITIIVMGYIMNMNYTGIAMSSLFHL